MKNFIKRMFIAKNPDELTKSEWYHIVGMLYFYVFYHLVSRIRDSDMQEADTYMPWGDWFRLHRHEWKHPQEGTFFLAKLDKTEESVFFYWLREVKQDKTESFKEWRATQNIAPMGQAEEKVPQPDVPPLT